jgi:hypothetical protein
MPNYRSLPKQFFLFFLSIFMSVSQAENEARTDEKASFSQIYPILKNNCAGCHIDNGTAFAAWTLDTLPSAEKYNQCLDADSPLLCTTYIKLTEGEYPWAIPGNLADSPHYVNACVPEESYHIGVSIPARLSDEECNLLKNWILQGAKR